MMMVNVVFCWLYLWVAVAVTVCIMVLHTPIIL